MRHDVLDRCVIVLTLSCACGGGDDDAPLADADSGANDAASDTVADTGTQDDADPDGDATGGDGDESDDGSTSDTGGDDGATPDDGPFLLYDGAGGVTRKSFNAEAALAWRNEFGDWRDAEGVEQGDAPIATTIVPDRDAAQSVEIDLGAALVDGPDWLWEGVLLRVPPGGENGITVFHSREATDPTTHPKLVLRTRAARSWSCCRPPTCTSTHRRPAGSERRRRGACRAPTTRCCASHHPSRRSSPRR